MSNFLDDTAAELGELLNEEAGRSITITQGRTTLESITGVMHTVMHRVVDAEGFATRVKRHNWTLVAEDLGDLQLRSGAVISYTPTGGTERRYMVLPPSDDEPAVSPKDAAGVLLSVHTELVESDG